MSTPWAPREPEDQHLIAEVPVILIEAREHFLEPLHLGQVTARVFFSRKHSSVFLGNVAFDLALTT